MQAAAGEGGLLIWGNYWREDTVESCQLPTFPTAGGMNASVLKWGMALDGARRFHYRVEARNKEQAPLLRLTVSQHPKMCELCAYETCSWGCSHGRNYRTSSFK